mmetsp:Transcript_36130/g.84618  ORF Transcript_36130/g.84618 Transcript_36130/m.84618 type:complete len:210 (+) Transcript_36130:1250-1879(+)
MLDGKFGCWRISLPREPVVAWPPCHFTEEVCRNTAARNNKASQQSRRRSDCLGLVRCPGPQSGRIHCRRPAPQKSNLPFVQGKATSAGAVRRSPLLTAQTCVWLCPGGRLLNVGALSLAPVCRDDSVEARCISSLRLPCAFLIVLFESPAPARFTLPLRVLHEECCSASPGFAVMTHFALARWVRRFGGCWFAGAVSCGPPFRHTPSLV